MTRFGGFWLLAWGVIWLSPFHQSLAQETNTALQPPHASVVMIASLAWPKANEEVIQAIRGQLSDLDVKFVVEWTDPASSALPLQVEFAQEVARRTDAMTVFWCDLGRAEEVYLYLSDAGQRRVMVRRLEAEEEGDRFESLALIVRSAVESMLLGGQIEVAIPAPSPIPLAKIEVAAPKQTEKEATEEVQLPVGPVTIEEQSDMGLEIGIGYSVLGYSTEHPYLQGLGLSFGLKFKAGWLLFAEYVIRGVMKTDSAETFIDVSSHPVFLGFGYEWTIGDHLRLNMAAVLIGDYLTQETRATKDSFLPHDNADFIFGIGPFFGAIFDLSHGIAIKLSLGAEVVINPVRYVTDDDGDKEVVAASWRFKPHGNLGLCFTLF